MTESDWKRLLRQIRGGYVVPVPGPQLLAGPDGALSIQRVVADIHDEIARDAQLLP